MQASQPVLLLWWCTYHRRSRRRSRRMPELQGTSVMAVSVTDEWVNSKGLLDPLSEVDPAEYPLSIRSLYVLLGGSHGPRCCRLTLAGKFCD